MQDPLITAIMIAVKAHDAQVDKAGRPYIHHALRVLDQVRTRLPLDIDAQCAAVLHDVVEDCGFTAADLDAEGMTQRTIDLVYALTKTAHPRHYDDWVEWLAGHRDLAAPIIKLADVRDNGSIVRLAMITDEALRERLRAKYERAQLALIDGMARRPVC